VLIDEALALALEEFTSASHRKRRMLALRDELTPHAAASFVPCPTLEAFLCFQLATAARRGETLALQWADVDFVRQRAFLRETKNGTVRYLALRDDLIELLKELPRNAERVFDLTAKTCTTAWKAILARAGIENLTIHDLRHEAISAVAETRRFNLLDLAAFSGHRDLRMLQRYAHLCTTRLAAEISAAVKEGTLKNGRARFNPKELSMRTLVQHSVETAQGAAHERAAEAPPQAPASASGPAEPRPSAVVIPFPRRDAPQA